MKWPIGNQMTAKGQTRDPNTLRAQYLENSWRCYLATIVFYEIVCCEATVGYPSDSLASCVLFDVPVLCCLKRPRYDVHVSPTMKMS